MRLGTHIPTHFPPPSSQPNDILSSSIVVCERPSPFLYLGNPAVVAVNSTVGVTQGGSITLEVYVSGYPTVRNIHWYRLSPMKQEITSGATFQDSRRRIILRSVQASAAGPYECEAQIPLFGGRILRASARIQLQVYGKLVSGCGYLIMYCTKVLLRKETNHVQCTK